MPKPTKRLAGRETIAGLKRLLADVNGEWAADAEALKSRHQAEYSEMRSALEARLKDAEDAERLATKQAADAHAAGADLRDRYNALQRDNRVLRDKLMALTVALAKAEGYREAMEPPAPPRMIEAPAEPAKTAYALSTDFARMTVDAHPS